VTRRSGIKKGGEREGRGGREGRIVFAPTPPPLDEILNTRD